MAYPKSILSKRIVGADDPNDELWRRTLPVLLHIFCLGVQATAPRRLTLHALANIATAPLIWPMIVVRNVIHIAILLAAWWILGDALDPYDVVILEFGILAVFWKDIYEELRDLLLYSLVFLTLGRFLRWMCFGYLSASGFRQYWLTTPGMEHLVATMTQAISMEYSTKYDHVMHLYFDSNRPEKEKELKQLLDEYSMEIEGASGAGA